MPGTTETNLAIMRYTKSLIPSPTVVIILSSHLSTEEQMEAMWRRWAVDHEWLTKDIV